LLPADPDLSRGDVGFCLQVCDCNDECLHPEAVCVDLGTSGVEATGFRGTCLPRGMAASGMGLVCAQPVPPAIPEDEDGQARVGCSCWTSPRPADARWTLASVITLIVAAGRGFSRRISGMAT
jgi:hypothetical protein